MQLETDRAREAENLLNPVNEMIDGIDNLIYQRSFAFRKLVGLAIKVERVKKQPRQRILHFVSYLCRCASESGDPLLLYESFVRLNEFGGALLDTHLEFFSVSFYFLLEPALLISQALFLRCPSDGIEQHVFHNRFSDEIISSRTNDLRDDRQVRFTRNHDHGNIYSGRA